MSSIESAELASDTAFLPHLQKYGNVGGDCAIRACVPSRRGFQHVADFACQVVRGERLLQKGVVDLPVAQPGVGGVIIARHEENLDSRMLGDKPRRQFMAAQVGHGDVRDQEMNAPAVLLCKP